MSGTDTTKFLGVYRERIQRPRFFSSSLFFDTPKNAFHNSDKVEYDIIRQGQKIAVPVPTANSGYRRVEKKKSVNKDWAPIVFKVATSINAGELNRRFPGRNPYEDPDMAEAAAVLVLDQVEEIETEIRDAMEVHCAELLQTGTITPKDENNATVGTSYNFFPLDGTGTLASGDLIVTTGTEWHTEGTSGDPLSDLETLAGNMRKRGYNPNRLVFGTSAWQRFLANPVVLERYNLLKANFGTLEQSEDATGGTRQGRMNIGDYMFELWTYGGTYEKPYGSAITPYLATDKVVMTAPGRRIHTFGGIARFEGVGDQQALSYLPRRLSFVEEGFDISIFAYFDNPRENLIVCLGTRYLPVPISIDSFGCLDVAP